MKKVISLTLVVLIICTGAVIPAAAFNDVVIPTYDSYPEAPMPLGDNTVVSKTEIILCEDLGKVFFLNNNGLFELSPETGEYSVVDSYNPISITSKCYTNDRLYTSSNQEPNKILVFNLRTLSYEEPITTDYQRIPAMGADDKGRIYFSASPTGGRTQTDFLMIDREGNVLSKINLQNNIREFCAFDSNENAFYTVSAKTKSIYVLRKGYAEGNELVYNEDEYSELTDSAGNELSKIERIYGQFFVVDYNNSSTINIYNPDFDGFENPVQTINRGYIDDTQTIGSLAAYLPNNDSFVVRYSTTVLGEFNDSGEMVHSFIFPYTLLSVNNYKGKILAVGEKSGQYYYNLIDWKDPTKITLNSSEISITPNSSFKLSAESDTIFPQSYTFSSQDTSIADVASDGTVYGWRNGETYIDCVSDYGLSAQCKVTVTDAVQGSGKLPEISVLNNTLPNNINENNYTVRSKVCNSYLTEKADGTYETVSADDNKVIVTGYDRTQKHITGTKTINFELPLFGGFYSGEKYNFIVFGQKNPDETTDTEVIRVVKYNKAWERLSAVSAYGCNTAEPFRSGSLRMTECGGKLYIHTCHLFFKDEQGDNHQGNMSFVIDEEEDAISQCFYNVWTYDYICASHSFNQFIDTDGDFIYRVDHGDKNPRSILITKCDANGSITKTVTKETIHFEGFPGDNYTGASVGGMTVNSSDILIACNSDGEFSERTEDDIISSNRNIMIIHADKDLKNSDIKWLTEYTEDENIMVGTSQMIKIGNNKNLVLWTETERENYTSVTKAVTLNHRGEKISEIVEINADLSDCQPILCSDNSVRWYASDGEKTTIYSITPQDIVDYQISCYGDIDKNGRTDINDATALQRYIAQFVDSENINTEIADLNSDGQITVGDVTYLQQYLVGENA